MHPSATNEGLLSGPVLTVYSDAQQLIFQLVKESTLKYQYFEGHISHQSSWDLGIEIEDNEEQKSILYGGQSYDNYGLYSWEKGYGENLYLLE